LRAGFVLVGNVPTTDGTFGTIGQGALQIIDQHGHLRQTWTDPEFSTAPGPCHRRSGSEARVFVSNVLNGTVARLDVSVAANGLTLQKKTIIAKGYQHVPNTAALILAPRPRL